MLSPTAVSDSTSLSDDPLAGKPYRAIRLLGAGSMGEVFLAEDRKRATPCVVKIQHARLARDPNLVDRIRLEAEVLSRLNHENVVSILDSGRTADERPFIVMEYLRGQTMADELAARGRLPLLEALDYTCQLLRGLAKAHAVGIVHRDIKPDNLFLCDGPRGHRVLKLLDFGVACPMPDSLPFGPSPLAVPTATGTVVGALRYVSPEGALARRVDHRADLYSAALVLYLALAGRGPFDHIESALLLLSAHVAEEPEPPSRFAKTLIPAELDQAVLRALRKAPEERFQSAHELREELERIMNQVPRAPSTSPIRSLPEATESSPDSSGSRLRTAKLTEVPAPALDPTGPLQVGARFLDKYEIREQIGRGGQAWVYHGQHIFTGREVAIKIVHSPRGMTREVLERGRAEARALGKLDHPNIVVMHDAGVTDDGLFYIVMELLRGSSLRAALAAHGALGVEEVLQLAAQTAEAVQAAHELGLIHRDLTPDNIFLTRDNRVKVLDFGIAKVLNEFGFTTHKDIVMGSILYMSPEQVQGFALTPASDICALGLLMFEMLLGKHPTLLLFEQGLRERDEPLRRATLAEIPPLQLNRTPPLLSELNPNIPLELARLVQRAMAKNPEDRLPTMRDFVAQIRACQDGLHGQTPVTAREANLRDLSRPLGQESEQPPASQRTTPRRGLVWDGALSLTPTGSRAESLAVTTAITGVPANSAKRRPAPRRAPASRRSQRNGLMLAGFLGAALGSLSAFWHFDAASLIGPQAATPIAAMTSAGTSTTAMVASLSPALPLTAPEDMHGLEAQPEHALSAVADVSPSPPSPVALGAAAHSSPTLRRTPPSSTTGSVPPKASDRIVDVSLPLEIGSGIGNQRRKAPAASTEAPRKKLNGGKLIYGD